MKIKMSKVIEIQKLYSIIKEKVLPIKVTYKFTKLFAILEKELNFYSEQLTLLLNEYGEKDEEGKPKYLDDGSVKIEQKFAEECQNKFSELLNLEVDIDNISFTLDELEPLSLSIEDFNCLVELIEE